MMYINHNQKVYNLVLSDSGHMPIQMKENVKNDIVRQGYSLVASRDIFFGEDLRGSLEDLVVSWDNLELDAYLADGGRYRERRYGCFLFTPKTKRLKLQNDVAYYQSKDYNPLNGGVARKFAPLTQEIVDNNFLIQLIYTHFDQLLLSENLASGNFWVGVHQIRTIAKPGELGKPTPEGVHKDGEMYTVQHFIKMENADGGTFNIFDNNKKKLADWTQRDTLDTVYICDNLIYHSVSPIVSRDSLNPGIRDILLIDYNPINQF